MFIQHIEKPGQTDGDTHTGQRLVDVVASQIIVAAAGADRADLGVIQKGGFVYGAGVVVKTSCDGQINGKVLLGNTEGCQIGSHRLQLLQAFRQQLFAAVSL